MTIEEVPERILALERKIEELELQKATREEWLTPKQMAERMSCSVGKVYQMIRNNEIQTLKIGSDYKIPISQFTIQGEEAEVKKPKRQQKELNKSMKDIVFG